MLLFHHALIAASCNHSLFQLVGHDSYENSSLKPRLSTAQCSLIVQLKLEAEIDFCFSWSGHPKGGMACYAESRGGQSQQAQTEIRQHLTGEPSKLMNQ